MILGARDQSLATFFPKARTFLHSGKGDLNLNSENIPAERKKKNTPQV